ncbi:MAG: hypothetical protein LBD23_06740 [Oscillospiraceae bacterium]|jgi:chromosome segregation ATPase|nr:hypothetical protein [Oscillospiraceae bacterium]
MDELLNAINIMMDEKLDGVYENVSTMMDEKLDVVHEKLDGVYENVSTMMDEKLEPIKTDIAELKTDVAELKTDIAELKTDVAELKTDIAELKTDMAELKTDVRKIEIVQENEILPGIRLLREGHDSLRNKLDELEVLPDKVDELQFSVNILKGSLKEHIQIHSEIGY